MIIENLDDVYFQDIEKTKLKYEFNCFRKYQMITYLLRMIN